MPRAYLPPRGGKQTDPAGLANPNAGSAHHSNGTSTPKVDRIPCRYTDCHLTFKNKASLLDHLIEEPNHEYCEACDVCLQDWDDLMRHMAQSANHIACPSCGREFQSVKGMERHVAQSHRAEQKLTCYGCNVIFRTAGDMIGHLEKGLCRNTEQPKQSITKTSFQDHINQKTIINRMLKGDGLRMKSPSGPGSIASSGNQFGGENENSSVLLDEPTSENSNPTPALQPTPSAPRPTSVGASHNTQPRSQNMKNVTDSVSSLHLSGGGADLSSQHNGSTSQSRSNSSIQGGPGASAWANGPSAAVKAVPPSQGEPTAFAAGLQTLNYEYAQKNPGSAPPSRHTGASVSGFTSMDPSDWNTRFWNPRSDAWDPNRFFNSLIEAYECPHKECNFTDPSAAAFTSHCFDGHRPDVFRCPSCLREYKSLQALVQHCEAPSHKCQIRKARAYNQFMDFITGGFIDASRKNERGEVLYDVQKPAEFGDRTKDPSFW